ncbi:MAG: universal stress protein [Gemmatimonadetes bacterium]|nr:universal stress protein [Gemmatimonadota bacterium]
MYTELLIPLDGSPLADAAIPHAAEIARRLMGGLHLVRVFTPMSTLGAPPEAAALIPDPAWNDRMEADARLWLERRAESVRTTTGLAVTHELRVGAPVDEIVAAAAERRAAAIVCSTHGLGGWALRWLGSVADGVIRHAACPVLAMSEDAVARTPDVKKVLLLHDGSDISEAMVPHAAWLARAFGASIDVLRVVAPPWVGDAFTTVRDAGEDPFGIDAFAEEAKVEIERVAAKLRADGFGVTSTVSVNVSPARAILDHVEKTDPDVIAVATYGRGLSRLFLGSVADKVLRSGARPTLCFRPARHVGELVEHEEQLMASTPA